ncbi:MAG TPA: RHS repeat domain-containing protein [Solirubrobacteraceae bacterium]|nr:RHS repeat domain-containing protein [Solirubrobacteraceae bacterium]
MSGGTTKTIKSAYNSLGQLTEYTDAAGNKATFEYEKEGDARLLKVADAKGSQTYHYSETTGRLAELEDSGAGAFKATYDAEGNMASETYPNAMTANFARNPAGEPTGIEYVKTVHCAKTCPEVWFSDTTTPSIHGEVLRQVSTLSEEPSYTYDAAGRLTQVQEIPAGEGCTTRGYVYDEEGSRTSLTTTAPGAEGNCISEGGATERHSYDSADRMIDSGVAYETFGNTTNLPAADAGGSELTSQYYVDNQLAKQEQNKETIEYKLDPEERTFETISQGNTSATLISHYDDTGGALAWTGEGSGEAEKWTRNVPGIDGALTALQQGEGKTSKAVTLQLHDLKGDIVGEASDSEAETKLLRTYNSTEFGVPSGKAPLPKYAWLGAAGATSELPSGVIAQDGVTYVPQTGQPLQTQPVELPLPTNAGNPYVRENADGAEWAAISTALRVSEYWQAQKAGSCNEEAEPCGADPAHGPNPWGCYVWASWKHYFNNRIGIDGHWACAVAPADIELQVALLHVVNGKYVVEETAKTVLDYPGSGGGSTGGAYSNTWVCEEGYTYQAWVWGRTWDGFTKNTTWAATAEDGHYEKCPTAYSDPTPGPPGSDP